MKPLLKNYILPPLIHLFAWLLLPLFLIVWWIAKDYRKWAEKHLDYDYDEDFTH
jgi:hypothetical protein